MLLSASILTWRKLSKVYEMFDKWKTLTHYKFNSNIKYEKQLNEDFHTSYRPDILLK